MDKHDPNKPKYIFMMEELRIYNNSNSLCPRLCGSFRVLLQAVQPVARTRKLLSARYSAANGT